MRDVFLAPADISSKSTSLKYNQYIRTLSKYPPFNKLICLIGPLRYTVPIWPYINDAVLYAVIGQMLSMSASISIIERLHRRLGSSDNILLWAEKNHSKKGPAIGVSQRKRKALKAWSAYAADNHGRWKHWKHVPLNTYNHEICSIWGFGRWSADMIAIFHLGRMDIWPETDSGIQKTSRLVFGTSDYEKIRRVISGSETVAALYLWELINRNLLHHFAGTANG
jgi:DNA-3-methyladenine glycosylase II